MSHAHPKWCQWKKFVNPCSMFRFLGNKSHTCLWLLPFNHIMIFGTVEIGRIQLWYEHRLTVSKNRKYVHVSHFTAYTQLDKFVSKKFWEWGPFKCKVLKNFRFCFTLSARYCVDRRTWKRNFSLVPFPELIAFKFTQLSTYLLLDRSRCRSNIIITCFDAAKCSILGDTFYYMGS